MAEVGSPQLSTRDITRAHGANDSMGSMALDSPDPTRRSFQLPSSDYFQAGDLFPTARSAVHPPDHITSNPFITAGGGAQSSGTYGQSTGIYIDTTDTWTGTGGMQPPSLSPQGWSDPASPSAREGSSYRLSDVSMLSRTSGSPRRNSPSGSPGRGERRMSVAEDPNEVLSALNASGWRGESRRCFFFIWY